MRSLPSSLVILLSLCLLVLWASAGLSSLQPVLVHGDAPGPGSAGTGSDKAGDTGLLAQLVPVCDGFDFPVGAPDAAGYYDAQPFGRNHHLGSDWNGRGGGNSDRGDPVTAAATGLVTTAEHVGGGWGNVVIVLHRLPDRTFAETLYGHLDRIDVALGSTVERGQRLGSIGDADGAYAAHLHFELRDSVGLGVGPGYMAQPRGWEDPTAFIAAHRPASMKAQSILAMLLPDS